MAAGRRNSMLFLEQDIWFSIAKSENNHYKRGQCQLLRHANGSLLYSISEGQENHTNRIVSATPGSRDKVLCIQNGDGMCVTLFFDEKTIKDIWLHCITRNLPSVPGKEMDGSKQIIREQRRTSIEEGTGPSMSRNRKIITKGMMKAFGSRSPEPQEGTTNWFVPPVDTTEESTAKQNVDNIYGNVSSESSREADHAVAGDDQDIYLEVFDDDDRTQGSEKAERTDSDVSGKRPLRPKLKRDPTYENVDVEVSSPEIETTDMKSYPEERRLSNTQLAETKDAITVEVSIPKKLCSIGCVFFEDVDDGVMISKTALTEYLRKGDKVIQIGDIDVQTARKDFVEFMFNGVASDHVNMRVLRKLTR